MRAADCSDPAVSAAKATFQTTATQQLKGLMSQGVESCQASTQLMDELTNHRAGQAGGAVWNSPHLQDVVASTGFSPALAARTLLLKDEITQLRRQGHSTATVIEQLNRRLRNASRIRKAEPSENTGLWCTPPSQPQLHLTKKHKANDELAAASPSGSFATLCMSENVRVHHGTRAPNDKRNREDPTHAGQLAGKKLKLRAGLGDT